MPEITLPGAIAARFLASPDTAWIDGGITYGVAPTFDASVKFYVTFWLISGRDLTNTGPGFVKDQRYQFDAYGKNMEDVERIISIVEAMFNHRTLKVNPLSYSGGSAFTAIPGVEAIDGREYIDQSGQPLRRKHQDFLFRSNRSFPV